MGGYGPGLLPYHILYPPVLFVSEERASRSNILEYVMCTRGSGYFLLAHPLTHPLTNRALG